MCKNCKIHTKVIFTIRLPGATVCVDQEEGSEKYAEGYFCYQRLPERGDCIDQLSGKALELRAQGSAYPYRQKKFWTSIEAAAWDIEKPPSYETVL